MKPGIGGERRRTRWRRRLTAIVVCALAQPAAPAAREFQTAEFASLRVTIDSDWVSRAAPGYVPVRFDITNLGNDRVIDIVGEGSRYFSGAAGSGTGTMLVRQSVRLSHGDHVRLTVPVPVFANLENIRFEIFEGNRSLQRFTYEGIQSREPSVDAAALIVADPGSPLGAVASHLQRRLVGRGSVAVYGSVVAGAPVRAVVSGAASGASIGRTLSAPTLDTVIEPSRLPTNWLGFTSLRAVVIGASEWKALSDVQQAAILTWVAAGGDVVFVDGDLATLLPSAKGEPATDPDRVQARYFFGRVHVLTSAALVAAGMVKMLAATTLAHDVYWALPVNTTPDWGTIDTHGFRLGIPGITGVPARVYLGILLLFSVLIGPVNYWWLRRRRQLVLFILTVPAISMAFVVVLLGYAVVGEGFDVQGRAVTFTILDQQTRQASTRATVSLYAAGMTPSGGLGFARDAAVFPIGPDGAGPRGTLSLDLTDTQRFTQGLVQARAPTNYEEIAFRPARERLTFSQDAGGTSVTNGLDAPVAALLYRVGATLYRLTGPLPSGGRQTLASGPFDAARPASAGVAVPPKFADLVQHQPDGSYIAVLERSPFWDPGVAGVLEHGSVHLVLGWPEGQR